MSVCDYVWSLTATVTWTLTDPANTNLPFTEGVHHYVIATTIVIIHIDNVLYTLIMYYTGVTSFREIGCLQTLDQSPF